MWNNILAPTFPSQSSSPGATSTKSKPMISLFVSANLLNKYAACSKENPPGTGVPVFGQYQGYIPSISKEIQTFSGNEAIMWSHCCCQVLPSNVSCFKSISVCTKTLSFKATSTSCSQESLIPTCTILEI